MSGKTSATFHTLLCKLLDIRYPIVQTGIAGSNTPNLVAA